MYSIELLCAAKAGHPATGLLWHDAVVKQPWTPQHPIAVKLLTTPMQQMQLLLLLLLLQRPFLMQSIPQQGVAGHTAAVNAVATSERTLHCNAHLRRTYRPRYESCSISTLLTLKGSSCWLVGPLAARGPSCTRHHILRAMQHEYPCKRLQPAWCADCCLPPCRVRSDQRCMHCPADRSSADHFAWSVTSVRCGFM